MVKFVSYQRKKTPSTFYYLVLMPLSSINSNIKKEPYSLSRWKRIVAGPQAQNSHHWVTSCTLSSGQRQNFNCCFKIRRKNCRGLPKSFFLKFSWTDGTDCDYKLTFYCKLEIKLQKQHRLNKTTIYFFQSIYIWSLQLRVENSIRSWRPVILQVRVPPSSCTAYL